MEKNTLREASHKNAMGRNATDVDFSLYQTMNFFFPPDVKNSKEPTQKHKI